MPFPSFIFLIPKYTNNRIEFIFERKEVGFDFSRKTKSYCNSEKASESIPRSMQGSITVEMVICVPLFLYAALCLIWMLEIRSIQTVIRSELHKAGKELAVETAEYPFFHSDWLKEKLTSSVDKNRFNRSMIVNGVSGIHCDDSYSIPGRGIYELSVNYRVRLPIPFFSYLGMKLEDHIRVKAWNGYVKNIGLGEFVQEIVYVTETGIVYHTDANCVYLQPKIKEASKDDITDMRNENGAKYYPCRRCGKFMSEKNAVYLTDYGTSYHSSRYCSSIKRTSASIFVYRFSVRE